MSELVYTTVPGKIKPLLSKIKGIGVPAKVTAAWLKSIGFKSSNDPSLIGVLKLVGLIDGSNAPTDNWQKYRGAKAAAVLGEGIRNGYSDLYAVYPDAHLQPNSALEHVFNTSSKAGKQTISKTIGTFKALVNEAEFESVEAPEELHVEATTSRSQQRAVPEVRSRSALSGGPSIHIDVQVHISPEASPNQIDQIFASMAKHLFTSKD
jgi:hypothetical protein